MSWKLQEHRDISRVIGQWGVLFARVVKGRIVRNLETQSPGYSGKVFEGAGDEASGGEPWIS